MSEDNSVSRMASAAREFLDAYADFCKESVVRKGKVIMSKTMPRGKIADLPKGINAQRAVGDSDGALLDAASAVHNLLRHYDAGVRFVGTRFYLIATGHLGLSPEASCEEHTEAAKRYNPLAIMDQHHDAKLRDALNPQG